MALEYPMIDPVALDLGILQIRWYALAYIAAFLLGWRYVVTLADRRARLMGLDPKRQPDASRMRPSADHIGDLVSWMIIGVIIGGRLGYVAFYQPGYYLENPLEIVQVWRGGMAFHGGFLGAVAAIALYAKRHGLPMLVLGDFVAAAAPLGLCLGRIANFINAELYGRAADVPWAMVFPNSDGAPRHPSQLYQAGLEGLILFIILAVLATMPRILKRPGILCGSFLIGYGLARIIGEMFREPDPQLGFLFETITMGQVLSAPMILIGMALISWSVKRGEHLGEPGPMPAPDGKPQKPAGKNAKKEAS